MTKPWFDIVNRKWGVAQNEQDHCVYELVADPNYSHIAFPSAAMTPRIWVVVFTDQRRAGCIDYVKARLTSWEKENGKQVASAR